jgi:hypothetical protein
MEVRNWIEKRNSPKEPAMNRRQFLAASAGLAVGAGAFPAAASLPAAVHGAGRAIRVWEVVRREPGYPLLRLHRLNADTEWSTLVGWFDRGLVHDVREIQAHQIEL